MDYLPESFVDLLFVDPPYNLNKTFNSNSFKEMTTKDYIDWIDSWLSKLIRTLKKTASIFICGDYRSSGAIQQVGEKYFKVRNRIVWEREKGRGAKANWKNNTEDIWYFTVSDDYTFNLDAVKLKKKVLAPYKVNGQPKDWEESENGNYRLTHPSNIWTDLTVPFWSMSENTDHPTQKPEKLLAKIILASSSENDFVFDPFIGSGTTSVVAKKLVLRTDLIISKFFTVEFWLPEISLIPAASTTALTGPPAITPVPVGAGFNMTLPAPCFRVKAKGMVVPSRGTINIFFLASSLR